MRPIYEYRDFRKYIADYYAEQKKINGFSWRDFAKAAKFGSPVFLKLVCEAKSGLSKKATDQVATAMGLEGFEKEYFILLVTYNQAKNATTKNEAFSELQEIILGNRIGILEKSLYQYYSNWLNSAIRELASSVASASPKELAELLQTEVQANAISESLKFLTKSKLLRKSTIKGQYTQGHKSISTGPLPTSVMAVRNLHRQMGMLALDSLDNVPVTERNFSTVTLGLTEEAYQKVVSEFANFRKKIVDIAAASPLTDRVYEMNLQLFPLSKKIPVEKQKITIPRKKAFSDKGIQK
jgi:uncharacterized protein (TIGR02147 family)